MKLKKRLFITFFLLFGFHQNSNAYLVIERVGRTATAMIKAQGGKPLTENELAVVLKAFTDWGSFYPLEASITEQIGDEWLPIGNPSARFDALFIFDALKHPQLKYNPVFLDVAFKFLCDDHSNEQFFHSIDKKSLAHVVTQFPELEPIMKNHFLNTLGLDNDILQKINDGSILSDEELNKAQTFLQKNHPKKYDQKVASTIAPPEERGTFTYNDFTLLYQEIILAVMRHPQLKNNLTVINDILYYIFNQESHFSYESYQAFMPFVENHGADYLNMSDIDYINHALNQNPVINAYVNPRNELLPRNCIFCDRALARYIEKYGTAQENSEILASLMQDFKFRPHTISALSKKLGDVNTAIADLKQKLVNHCTQKEDLFDCDVLINAFPELKSDVKQQLVRKGTPLTIDSRITNIAYFQEINTAIEVVKKHVEQLSST